jgi:hypothetical protein
VFVFHKLLKGLLLFYTKLFQPTFLTTTKNNALRIAEKSVIAPIAINRVCAKASKYLVIATLTT